jgi:pilus assembly protein Flp/PilA
LRFAKADTSKQRNAEKENIMTINGTEVFPGDGHAIETQEINTIPRLLARLWREDGAQGLVEYVLILALVAFAAVAGMSSLATSINSAFAKVGTYLGKYIS